MNAGDIANNAFDSVTKGKVAFLCGAGISRNSGFPIAADFKNSVFMALARDLSRSGIQSVEKMPMEQLLENLSRFVGISELIDVFRDGKPGVAHVILARLFSRHLCNCIATTNIDQLFEQALLAEGNNIRPFVSSNNLGSQLKPPCLLKLHGDVQDKESVMMTIKNVARRECIAATRRMLEGVFRSWDHDTVIILGYSCSDTLDINPFLRSIAGRKTKQVIFIEHSAELSMENAILGSLPPVFDGFEGQTLKVKTEEFVNALAQHCHLRTTHTKFTAVKAECLAR